MGALRSWKEESHAAHSVKSQIGHQYRHGNQLTLHGYADGSSALCSHPKKRVSEIPADPGVPLIDELLNKILSI